MKRILVAGVALAALCSAPAFAADIPVKGPVYKAAVAPLWHWTGCYVGIAGGYAWGKSDHRNAPAGSITGGAFDVNGGIFGGTLGCNYQFAPVWVIGIEGDFSWSGKKGSAADVPPFNPAFTSETREKWLSTLRARLGLKVGAQNQGLLYVTGGLAIADVEIHVFGPGFNATESKTRTGGTVGLGLEWAITGPPPPLPWWSVKFEYLYVAFNNKDYFNPPPAGFVNRAAGVTLNDHILRVGLNAHF